MSANRLMDKLKCWKKHSKVELKSRYRTVLNNVCLDFNPDTEQPAQIKYKPNSIKTTKYSIWTFLPKNLFEQFHRLANVYFLFIALLNFIPRVNAFGKEIALIPVIAVLTVTGIKDAVEDYRRYRQDVKVNSALTLVYDKSKGDYIEIEWNRVRVGDIVKVKCNEVIPADLLLLSCSEGLSTCFIETANLDGMLYTINSRGHTAACSLVDNSKMDEIVNRFRVPDLGSGGKDLKKLLKAACPS